MLSPSPIWRHSEQVSGLQYFMLGKHSFRIIMRIFGRTASAVRFSILRRRPAPFREGAEYAIASYSAAPGAHAQAELSFHRSHSAAKCDVGWQSETLTHTFFDLLFPG
ncbi:hypothetical protein DXC62_08650 [Ruminococcaceae bacterium TF06-43]|nr:hypothetical protein DXC62_08650 [Ruminococcaceae bacterium TF06-43]